jgi:hypothetical protein
MEGRLPDFMIIGAMKSGTTSLHDYLGKHPDIFVSKTKEIDYFIDQHFNNHDINWYKSQFVSDKKLVGTSPQNYTKKHVNHYQGIPQRLKKYVPNVKMIYILRNPVERYKSHLLENYYGETKEVIERSIRIKNPEYTSCYYYQLEEYLKYFELSQIHILTLDDLKSKRLETLNKIFEFLEVKQMNDDTLFNFISNDHKQKILPNRVVSKLPFRILKKTVPSLADKLASSKALKTYIYKGGQKKYLSEEEIDRLKSLFREDVQKLEQLTGKSFAHWNL